MTRVPADGLLAAARNGDGRAFGTLVEPHLRAIHLHCYRMLGSFDDADEALQEVLLRSWRGLDTFQERAPLRHWLIRIATNACLRAIERKGRLPITTGEVDYLQPYPDALLDHAPDVSDPAAVVEGRENVALAFIVALQRLPATQRAALILKDVLGWSSADVAGLLGSSAPAVNSLLQRARGTLGAATGPRRPLDGRDEAVLGRFVDAWRRSDFAALAAVLHEDAVLRMPPEHLVVHGREGITKFLATAPAGGRLELFTLTETRANGHPAFAAYLADEETGACEGYGLVVCTVAGDRVGTVTGFRVPSLFAHFGLPAVREAAVRGRPAGG
ncbi:sigma-70 family RNA polymerase sigma factor [Actinomadura soli]|uniref:Sigma-70 family RNA polymerase sigma factor n=1 Tax=Actinomadura soli TaxID=2508997 RepID=A0A5C4J1Y3_9ACTN|nr:RNA polymerase subunit sigma-70 [Actinomadura soli]TMQ90734.1 sigma-70 family RNA polymerase sigma factor [Actinomadura soli]